MCDLQKFILKRYFLSFIFLMQVLIPISAANDQVPNKPIKIVVPFAPGGAQDGVARYFSMKLSDRLGVPVVVENKSGAGGIVAADMVAKSASDGSTLFLASGGAISIAPHLVSKLTYNPKRDFVPIAGLVDTPMLIAVRTESTIKTLTELVEIAKSAPGEFTFGATGNGTVSQLTGELFAQASGIQLSLVPYRGAAPAIVDLIGGRIRSIVTSAASLEPMIVSGKVRALASFTESRLEKFPDIPTVHEAIHISDLVIPVWSGILAPAGVPEAIQSRLSAELMTICKLPETKERMLELGADVACAGRKAFDDLIAADSLRWQQVIQRRNIKIE